MIRRLAGGLAARLTLTMVLALIAAQASSFLLFLMFRPLPLPLLTMRTLASAVEAAVRGAPLGELERAVQVERRASAPALPPDRGPPHLAELRRLIEANLGTAARQVLVGEVRRGPPGDGPRIFVAPPGGAPPGAPQGEGRPPGGPPPGATFNLMFEGGPRGPPPLMRNDPDRPLPPDVVVAVERAAGDWVVVSRSDGRSGFNYLLGPGASWLVAGLIVALVSIWSARRLIAPLGRLTTAVRRLGVERVAPPVEEAGPEELRAIARAFNEMSARLTRFVADRTQMVAAISHDLRTPLTRMRLRAEDMPEGAMQQRLLGDIAEMESMINATLAFARQDSETEAHRRVDLAALLVDLCNDRADAGQRADYAGPDHLVLWCQPVGMRRALANLIDNACMHGGGAQVGLVEHAGAVEVRIADEGPGIPPERMEEAFQPFRRLEPSRNRATGGVGLGLTVARDIVRAHGGDIALANGEPRGLIVTVTLPKPS